jgi:hypothetical protein
MRRISSGQGSAGGAVEGDDVCSSVADGLGGAEVGSNVDVAVGVAGLDDAYDGELRDGAEGRDPFNAFGSEPACAAAQDRGGDASEGVEIVQRIAFGGLTGDDEPSAKGVERRVSGGIRTLRHVRLSLRGGYSSQHCWKQLICNSRYCG